MENNKITIKEILLYIPKVIFNLECMILLVFRWLILMSVANMLNPSLLEKQTLFIQICIVMFIIYIITVWVLRIDWYYIEKLINIRKQRLNDGKQ